MNVKILSGASGLWIRVALATLILLPLFLQLQGTIYHSPKAPLYDSGGDLRTLPLPISLLACIACLPLLARFKDAKLSAAFMVLFAAGMAVTSIVAAGGEPGLRKVILFAQYCLPVFALFIGQMFEPAPGQDRVLARAFAYFLAWFIPLILYLTHVQYRGTATWDIEFFSIYQHRQYVPVVLVGAYLLGLFALWDSRIERPVVIVLGLLMGVYAGLSFSILALAFLLMGIVAFAIYARRPLIVGTLFVGVAEEYRVKFESLQNAAQGIWRSPGYVTARLEDWSMYWEGVLESWKSALFGHPEPFARSVSTSAHNYYLDLLYNFGLVALLPLLGLMAYTLALLARGRETIMKNPGSFGLALVVLFLLLVDSNFKVSLRQPYPGVFAFFLWGVLLARIGAVRQGMSAR